VEKSRIMVTRLYQISEAPAKLIGHNAPDKERPPLVVSLIASVKVTC
jgi:hypothetical protein